jgi:hypothetical protein
VHARPNKLFKETNMGVAARWLGWATEPGNKQPGGLVANDRWVPYIKGIRLLQSAEHLPTIVYNSVFSISYPKF